MLKNLSYVSLLAAFVAGLIGFVAIVQHNRIFVTSRSWLLGAGLCLLAGICFILLSINDHLEKRSGP